MSAPVYPGFRLSRWGICVASAAAALTSLTGCAFQIPFQQRSALDSHVGQSRVQLVAELGQPTAVLASSDGDILQYTYKAHQWVPGTPLARGPTDDPIGPWVNNTSCTTSFRVTEERVTSWSLSGDSCANVPYPSLGGADRALALAAEKGVDTVADYPHDRFTGGSTVGKGTFYER